MHIKNMIPALVAASLIGAPAIAFAQNEAAQPDAPDDGPQFNPDDEPPTPTEDEPF